jgi:hypothetical protein
MDTIVVNPGKLHRCSWMINLGGSAVFLQSVSVRWRVIIPVSLLNQSKPKLPRCRRP